MGARKRQCPTERIPLGAALLLGRDEREPLKFGLLHRDRAKRLELRRLRERKLVPGLKDLVTAPGEPRKTLNPRKGPSLVSKVAGLHPEAAEHAFDELVVLPPPPLVERRELRSLVVRVEPPSKLLVRPREPKREALPFGDIGRERHEGRVERQPFVGTEPGKVLLEDPKRVLDRRHLLTKADGLLGELHVVHDLRGLGGTGKEGGAGITQREKGK